MEHTYGWPLVYLGAFLLAGYAAHLIGQRTHLPRVTLLLLLGVLGGPEILGVVPPSLSEWFPYVAQVALSIVGFLLGERFLGRTLWKQGRGALLITGGETVGAALAVLGAVWLVSGDLTLALLLASVAPATDPAATLDVVRETESRGPLTRAVLEIVAIDDAFAIVLFSVLSTLATALGEAQPGLGALLAGAVEIVGGAALGIAFGIPMAWVTGRAKPGELTLVETLGFVLVCGGIASVLDVSYLIASMVLGATVANRAKHHTRPFHAIERVSQPFLIVFFLLAGFEFHPQSVPTLGVLGLGYVLARAGGKVLGAYLGSRWASCPASVRRYVGPCLMPQAGVALGLGLMVSSRFPEYGARLLTLLVGTTFLFELLGPIATRFALGRAGETATARAEAQR